MSELLLDSSSRIATDDERFGDVLPAADIEAAEDEERDAHDLFDTEVRHFDALTTIDQIAEIPKLSVDLGRRAHGLVRALETMSHISMLRGFLEGGSPKDVAAVHAKIEELTRQLNGELLDMSGLNDAVAVGELTRLEAGDQMVQIRHGLRTSYSGAEHAKARERYIRELKAQ